MSDVRWVTVSAWCGFADLHPPHLWADPLMGPRGPYMIVYPCPGRPHPDNTIGECNGCEGCPELVIGPNTDGEPCDWCQNCGCASAEHKDGA